MHRFSKIASRTLVAVLAVSLLISAVAYAMPMWQNANTPKVSTSSANGKIDPQKKLELKLLGKSYDYNTLAKSTVATAKPTKFKNASELLATLKSMNVLNPLIYQGQQFSLEYGSRDTSGSVAPSSGVDGNGSVPAPIPTTAPVSPEKEIALAGGGSGGGSAFTTTNTQVQGIDEGDIVKTDGKYIYVLSPQSYKITVIKADGKSMTQIGQIYYGSTNYVQEMYVSGDYLVTVSTRYESNTTNKQDEAIDRTMIYNPGKQFSVYTVYSLADRANPKQIREVEITGNPLSTRLIGKNLYIVASQYIYASNPDKLENDILPMYKDTAVSNKASYILPEKIDCFPNPVEASYQMVGAFDISGNTPCEFQTFLGAGNTLYMSQNAMYIARSIWSNDTNSTEIFKYNINGVNVAFAASGTVPGNVINQYCIDEFDGNLRIATNNWSKDGSSNAVYILDKSMKIIGKTDTLAAGETIQSVRFMGKYAYVVTFKQVDPLFVLDLSKPTAPKILGQLKVPGFSTYLHPLGEGLLVGFGRHIQDTYVKEDDGTERVVGTYDAGAKISLFDISDPTSPKEISVIKLGQNSNSEAFWNPRALMVDEGRNRFAFDFSQYGGMMKPVQDSASGVSFEDGFNGGVVVDVVNRKLVLAAKVSAGNQEYSQRRFCAIDNTLYFTSDKKITALDYNNFKELNTLLFQ